MDEDCGRAVKIVSAVNHTFELNEESLNTILLQNNIKDKKVVVISIAGAFRKGKSFMLNFVLKYLLEQGDPGWLGDENEPLRGFSWRGGSERDTTGILMWSKVFEVELPNGEEVAVLLMDTQGAFDSSSTVKECATVFALSTMISSIQVYNLSHNIQEDDLQHLELFTEYGRLAMEKDGHKPFQKLLFLVRDWSFPYEADYGREGGKKILDRRLEISDQQHPQLQTLRKHIRSCFSEVECFLMPHPGLEVSTSPDFDGRLSEIRPEYLDALQDFMQLLLAPCNLHPKLIGGVSVTAKDLINYITNPPEANSSNCSSACDKPSVIDVVWAYVEIFKGGELPEPKSMFDATADANNLSAVANSKDYYTAEMEKVCGGDRPYVNHETLYKLHFEVRSNALQKFLDTKKMGSEDLELSFKERLVKEIDEMYGSLIRFNDGKQIAHAIRTPGALLLIILICYLNITVLKTVGLDGFAASIHFFMVMTVIALALWGYSRFTGEVQHVGVFIDNIVMILLTHFVFPSQKQIATVFNREARGNGHGNSSGRTTPVTSQSSLVRLRN